MYNAYQGNNRGGGSNHNSELPSQEDLMNDPSMYMSLSIMNSIRATMDNQQQQREQYGQRPNLQQVPPIIRNFGASPADLAKVVEPSKPEVIELTPVQELTEKITQKAQLTKDEIRVITQCLNQHFSGVEVSVYLSSESECSQLNSFLQLTFFAIVNAHPFNAGKNYLENQALQKLAVDVLTLVKSILDKLPSPQKKQQNEQLPQIAILLNALLPPALKILSLFQGATEGINIDQNHYKYLRAKSIKLDTSSLSSLNQVLTEFAPHLFGPNKKEKQIQLAKKSNKRESEIITLPQNPSAQMNEAKLESASFEEFVNMLSFPQNEYQALAKQLSVQLQSHPDKPAAATEEMSDEAMSCDEEEKQPADFKTVEAAVREHISKSKINESFAKVLTLLADLTTSETDFFLYIDSHLLRSVQKSLNQIGGSLKTKSFDEQITKGLHDKALKSQAEIIDFFSKLKDIDRVMKMDVDSIQQKAFGDDVERKALFSQVQTLAKTLEIIAKFGGSDANGKLMDELVKQSQSLKYIYKLIKLDATKLEMTNLIESITNAFCRQFQDAFQVGNDFEKLLSLGKEQAVASMTRLVLCACKLSNILKKPAQIEINTVEQIHNATPIQLAHQLAQSSQAEQRPPSAYQPGIRTRGQARKETQNSSGSWKDSQKNDDKKSEQEKHEPQVPPKVNLVQIDCADLLKTSITLASALLSQMFSSDKQFDLSVDLLKVLQKISIEASLQSKFVSGLLNAILGSFITSVSNYTKQTVDNISSYLLLNHTKVTSDFSKTQYLIKLIFLLSSPSSSIGGRVTNPDLAFSLAIELLNSSWKTNNGEEATYHSQYYDLPLLYKYLLLLSCLIIVASSPQTTTEKRQQLCKAALSKSLRLCQITLLNEHSLKKFRPLISKFLVQLSLNSSSLSLNSAVSTLSNLADTISMQIFNSPQGTMIYDKQLLQSVRDGIQIEQIIEQLKATISQSFQGKTISDIRSYINQVLKQVVKMNNEVESGELKQSDTEVENLDFDSFVGLQMSLGVSSSQMINSKFDIHVNQKTQAILQDLRSNRTLSANDLEFIQSLQRSVKSVGEQIEQGNVNLLKEHLEKIPEISSEHEEIARLILQSQRGHSNANQKILRALQSLLMYSSLSNELVDLVIDPYATAKLIYNNKSASPSSPEEGIFAHCFSCLIQNKCQSDEKSSLKQGYCSIVILLRSLYFNLCQILRAQNQEDLKRHNQKFDSMVQELSSTLLQVKSYSPFIETNESASSFDFDQNERLLSRVQSGSLQNRDYLRLKEFDNCLLFLKKSIPLLPILKHNQYFITLCNEIATVAASITFNSNNDAQVYSNYLKLNNTHDALFGSTLQFYSESGDSTASSAIWSLALTYINYHVFKRNADGGVEVSRENKGGIQMNINFDSQEKDAAAGSKKKRGKRQVQFEKNQEGQKDQKDEKPKESEIALNPVANKLLTMILNSLIVDVVSSDNAKQISNAFRRGFLKQESGQSLLYGLIITNQVPFLKKFLYSLLKDDKEDLLIDPSVRAQLCAILLQHLESFILSIKQDSSLSTSESLILSLELASIIADNNSQIVEFVTQHILPVTEQAASVLQVTQSDSIDSIQLVKFTILDFLCQLAQSKYSIAATSDDSGKIKYSAQQIAERRKKYQEEKKQKQSERLMELSSVNEKAINSEFGCGNGQSQKDKTVSAEVEGFQQDKLLTNDEDSQKFMERPEELCTFARTRKEFSQQHWYWCYTCKLVENSGCCAVCAVKCHSGHHVVYSKKSNFFCDCGDSGKCKCIKPQSVASKSGAPGEKSIGNMMMELEKHRRKRDLQIDQLNRGMGFQPPQASMYGGPRNELGVSVSNMFGAPGNIDQFRPINYPGNFNGGVANAFPPPLFDDDQMRRVPNRYGQGAYGEPGMSNPFSDQPLFSLPNQEGGRRLQIDNSNPLGGGISVIPQFLDDSSEEDMLQDKILRMGEAGLDIGLADILSLNRHDRGQDRNEQPIPGNPSGMESVRQMMKLIKKVPSKMGGEQSRLSQDAKRALHGILGARQAFNEVQDLEQSDSQFSQVIDPVEDPLTDGELQTPLQLNIDKAMKPFSQLSSQNDDVEMVQESELQLQQEVVESMKNIQNQFKSAIESLLVKLDSQATEKFDIVMTDESHCELGLSKSVSDGSLKNVPVDILANKMSTCLTQDLTSQQKSFNNQTFQIKNYNDQSRQSISNNINLMNIIDSSKDGLVAVCEDQDVNLYAGSSFFEDANNINHNSHELFHISSKQDGGNQHLGKVDTYKCSFQAMQVQFNPSQPLYMAVIGPSQLDVVVLNNQGKVDYQVSIELMLDSISRDLNIVSAKWLPGSQTQIAVATKNFVKIYDLAEDTLSPTHNILIFNGFISDFAFSSPVTQQEDLSVAFSTIYITSKSGQVYYKENIQYSLNSFNKTRSLNPSQQNSNQDQVMSQMDNSDIMVTETLQIDRIGGYRIEEFNAVFVTHQGHYKDTIILSQSNGNLYFGKHQSGSNKLRSILVNVQQDGSFSSNPNMNLWQRQGREIVGMKAIKQTQNSSLSFLAFARQFGSNVSNCGLPLLIEVTENKIQVNIIKNNITGNNSVSIGLTQVKKSQAGSQAMKLVAIQLDGAAGSFNMQNEARSEEIDIFAERSKRFTPSFRLDQIIEKRDLPKEVKLPVQFFEKAKSLSSDNQIKQKLSITGDIQSSKNSIENLCRPTNGVTISENNKKSYKFQLKIEHNSEHIITGFRLRLDFSQNKNQSNSLTLKLFNRTVKLSNYQSNGNQQPLWFDIPFCDAESIYGSIAPRNLEIELLTDDPKACPIRICTIDIFGQSKKDFLYKEKVRKLEKVHGEKLQEQQKAAQSSGMTENQRIEESVKAELLRSKDAPLVSWKEKLKFLKDHASLSQIELIQNLDIVTQYMTIWPSVDNKEVQNSLFEKIKYFFIKTASSVSNSEYVHVALKRCMKKVLAALHPNAPLGSPYNFQTIKDQIFIEQTIAQLHQDSQIKLDEFRSCLKEIMKIHNHRFFSLFDIFTKYPTFIEELLVRYTTTLRSQSQDFKLMFNDIQDLVSLTIANYQFKVNQLGLLKGGQSLPEVISKVYEADLSKCFSLLNTLLQSESEQVQKSTISVILSSIQKYADTMAGIIKTNRLPTIRHKVSEGESSSLQVVETSAVAAVEASSNQDMLIVDFTPHLIQYSFKLLSDTGFSNNSDIAYQLAFKAMKKLEQNSTKLYSGKFIEQVINPVASFAKSVVSTDINSVAVGLELPSQAEKQLYINLVFLNSLMSRSTQKEEGNFMKIKQSQINLTESTQKLICEKLSSIEGLSEGFINFTKAIIASYQGLFENQKGSFRIKYDEGLPVSVYEVNLASGSAKGKKSLLRPINENSQWKWHPLFTKTDHQFELLDRKIPMQTLLAVQFLLINLSSFSLIGNQHLQPLIDQIAQFSFKKPSSSFMKVIGQQVIQTLLKASQKDIKDVSNVVETQYKDVGVFEEFFNQFEGLYFKKLKSKATINFNLQFLLHTLMQKLWNKASANHQSWQHFIVQSKRHQLLNYMIDSLYLLNDDTVQLCLQVCALALNSTVLLSFGTGIAENLQINLFSIFTRCAEKKNSQLDVLQPSKSSTQEQINLELSSGSLNFDINRLVDVLLLGRNKKQLRIGAAHLIKGVYDSCKDLKTQIKECIVGKLPLLRTKGANSLELIALLSYIINIDINEKGLDSDADLNSRITREVFKQVQRTNQQLTGHENLEIYATLSKIIPNFSSQTEITFDTDEEFVKRMSERTGGLFAAAPQRAQGNKVANPYMLESEACQKCFQQKSMPFTQCRLQDLKVENKFTDSTQIYRLNSSYQIKQIIVTQDNFRGNQVIKELAIYVNNKVNIDLADMKNNWAHWQKVKSQEVELGQRQIQIDFTLPVNATNILIQYITGLTSKSLHKDGRDKGYPGARGEKQQKKAKKSCPITSISQVKGVDSVIHILPKAVAAKLGVINEQGGASGKDENHISENEQLQCPRCGMKVQGRHGICNSCGENAMQCNICRNINYEKPDAFICNECGNSRFAKFDIGLVVKPGNASEKIESEDAKQQALNQIEQQLAQAQSSYSILMKTRQAIALLIRKVNDGNSEQSKLIIDTFNEQCADHYQKMMKSLSTIKSLKIEIDQFTQIGSGVAIAASQEASAKQQIVLSLSKQRSALSTEEDEQVQENCFSCIQEYLKGLLSFIQATSDKLAPLYMKQGFLDLLYRENLKMFSPFLLDPARKAICSLIKRSEADGKSLLETVQNELFEKKKVIPAHLLSININQETYLVLEILKSQAFIKDNDSQSVNYYETVQSFFWSIFFKSLVEAKSNAAIAEQISATFFTYIKEQLKLTNEKSAKELQELHYSLFGQAQQQTDFQKLQESSLGQNGNYLVYALTLQSSQRVRSEAKEILTQILSQKKELQTAILRSLLSVIDNVLILESSSGDQYFDLLSSILNAQTVKEKVTEEALKKTSASHIFVEAFDILFKQIDTELQKLVKQEKSRASLGQDGFMPQISTGQIFSRIVILVSQMIKESVHLKGIIQNNVNIVIKSFLKIKKLNLTKNKLIQQSEVEIEKMFKELHSQKEEERENFILECVKIIESGECDNQEMRFLFEEMCKVIEPAKPEPDYLLHLTRAHSQEFYFRGKMSKNPYSISQLGKTMADVRLKICREMELAEPELLELLVAGKLVNMDLSIKQVFEQVHWPALCKQRNPDIYDIPPIDEAPKGSLQPMQVIYRLMGIDGEAQEDRVETLQDGSELDSDPAAIQKKYGITQVFCKKFESKREPSTKTTAVRVLIDVLEGFGPLQQERYLAEWLFKLISYALKLDQNRKEFMKYKQTVDHLAKRLFESVGLQSQTESQKGMTLFDVILVLLDQFIVELNKQEDVTNSFTDSLMEIDQQGENLEAATHVQLFIKIMSDSCNEMLANNQGLDKTSKKIRAVSKILPFLINKEDVSAQKIIVDFIAESLTKLPLLDNLAELTAKEKMQAQFNIERVIEIIESIPVSKAYFKDLLVENCGQLLQSMANYVVNTTMVNLSQEQQVFKHKLANLYSLRIFLSLFKNHPPSQGALFSSHKALIDKFYELTQAKHNDKTLIILGNDIVETLTNKNHFNEPSVKEYLQKIIDQKDNEKKELAKRKREEAMKKMQNQKTANKFLKQLDNPILQEETGLKCIACREGYTKKPNEIMGMYVFSKKLKITEVSDNGSGFSNTMGYTTVTHSNCIHFICHQNAHRADSQLKQPKKEWEGAVIRNDHTKCNNLFPLRGGHLQMDNYGSMVERYFQQLNKSSGGCDNDRVKVLQHDFKMLMKRLAYEDSFSRDSQGGGPEHNMHLVPFFIQMIHYQLTQGGNFMPYGLGAMQMSGNSNHSFSQQQRIAEFLEQGMKLKKNFLQKLEEEKRAEEIEEDEKLDSDGNEEESVIAGRGARRMDEDEDGGNMSNLSLDHIVFMLTQCVTFCQLPLWEAKYKQMFFSIILCTVANVKDDGSDDQPKPVGQQTDFATGKRVLSITKATEDVEMSSLVEAIGDQTQAATDSTKRRRLSSDIKGSETLNKALIRLRPLLVFMRLVDQIKQMWDGKKLGLSVKNVSEPEKDLIPHDQYLRRLNDEFLSKGNLQEVIAECNELFREYKDRILKTASVEEFLSDMGMINHIVKAQGLPEGTPTSQAVESYILQHFQV